MAHRKAKLFEDGRLIAGDLTIDIEFGGSSLQATGPVEWNGYIRPPNEEVEVGKTYSLELTGCSECQIATKERNEIDKQVKFDGLGEPPRPR